MAISIVTDVDECADIFVELGPCGNVDITVDVDTLDSADIKIKVERGSCSEPEGGTG